MLENMLGLVNNGKKSETTKLQGTIYKCLLVTCLLCFSTHASPPKCCPSESFWIPKSKNCSDGSLVTINCPNGFYKIGPKNNLQNRFRLDEKRNISWFVFEKDLKSLIFNVSTERYCIGKVTNEETNDEAEIALICFDEQIQLFPKWRDIFFGMCSIISSLFLFLILLIYIVLPEMRDVQDKAIMSMMASFMVAFFFNGSQQLNLPSFEYIICLLVAFTMYYAYLAGFFWLNIISQNIWKSVWFPNFNTQNEKSYKVYCVIGWGMPFCFLTASLTTHNVDGYHLKPGFGEVNCWFNGNHPIWIYFYGPILVLLSMNLCYLSLTSLKLWYKYRGKSCCKLKVLRFKCLMYIKLAIIMGFTWIFEVISFAFGKVNYKYWILPDILNVLQGLFIFILLVVLRKKVRKSLAKRRPFNIPFPKSWIAYSDEENYEPVGPEEVELSQT